MQEDMLNARRDEFENSIEKLTSWDGFLDALDRKKMILTPWYAVHSATVLYSSCVQVSRWCEYAVLFMYVRFTNIRFTYYCRARKVCGSHCALATFSKQGSVAHVHASIAQKMPTNAEYLLSH